MDRSGDMETLRAYGLQVTADYRGLDLPLHAEQFTIAGERTVVLSGRVNLTVMVAGDSRLIVSVEGTTLAYLAITVAAGASLTIEHRGEVHGTVLVERVVTLEEGASVTDITAVAVWGRLDMLVRAVHTGARSTSRLLSKFAVQDGGRVLARGDITIDAQGCTGYERLDALLLAPSARADVLPTLHVANDDVACKHAATVGSVDDEHLFYLMSRGFSVHAARHLIARGFLDDVCVYGRT